MRRILEKVRGSAGTKDMIGDIEALACAMPLFKSHEDAKANGGFL
jgi:hypothetical protein